MQGDCRTIIFHSSLGWAAIAASEEGVCGIVLPRSDRNALQRALQGVACGSHLRRGDERNGPGICRMLKRAEILLRRFFSGERVVFDLPLDLRYYTDFQRAVWRATAEIPYGETRSYAWIARKIHNPRASRAVGQALGANPVPILIPCHRVISSAGRLGGFTGGIDMKARLLALEKAEGKY